jgi:hypothetical protein
LNATTVFDRVVFQDPNGARRTLTAKQFLALPLDVRIQHILARNVQFYHGEEPIDRAAALKSLRR